MNGHLHYIIPVIAALSLLCSAAVVTSAAEDASALSKSIPPFKHSVGETEGEIGFHQSIEVVSKLYSAKSLYQTIEIHESKHFGNILVLDDVIQITERDGDSYNEMMSHVPMFQHPNPKRVLIIGGGDGYVLHEVLKHDTVEHVDHVDLDGDVIETCKKFFPWGKTAWSDPRAHLHLADGSKFVQSTPNETYDVIIQDSSDPWTIDATTGELVKLPSSVLYEDEHFENLHRVLKSDGILNIQAESFNVPSSLNGITLWRSMMLNYFQKVRYGSIIIPSYPTGHIGFLMCEKQEKDHETVATIKQRYTALVKNNNIEPFTTYYHPGLQESAFQLPLWAMESIYGDPCQTDDDADQATE